ncbi:flagellar hook-basal body complex protein [Rosettibacter firmus]|uniref:flagellar hook-basal body complex protein n=1 Tax=Rosettibacter firmus TaxID=3111522 RepID=UPI00336C026E
MALLNSLFAGVSGLRNHQSMMDVIGNNISNVNTIGYKGSRVTFSDTFNQFVKAGTNPTASSGGTNSFQIGLGTKINSIDRNWNQGTFERTGITTDLALQGPGLFILKSNGQQLYSRAGAFIFDADGKLVNPQNGAVVQGKIANGLGEIPPGTTLQDIVIDKNMRLPAVKTTNVSWGGNLQSSSPTIRTDVVDLVGNLSNTAPTGSKYPEDGYTYNLKMFGNLSSSDTTTPYPNPSSGDPDIVDGYKEMVVYDNKNQPYYLYYKYEFNTVSSKWELKYQVYNSSQSSISSANDKTETIDFDGTDIVDIGLYDGSDADTNPDFPDLKFKIDLTEITNLAGSSNIDRTIQPITGNKIYSKDGKDFYLVNYYEFDGSDWYYYYKVFDNDGILVNNENTASNDADSNDGKIKLSFDNITGLLTGIEGTSAININFSNSANKLDFKINLNSLTNLNATTNPISRVDKGEIPEPVLGAVTIFDSLGNSHTLSIKFEHIDNNRWSWTVSVPTTSGTLSPNAFGEIYFDANGQIQSIWQAGNQVTTTPPTPQITFTPATGAEVQVIDLDFGKGTAGVTQTNLSSQIAALSQNGSASAALSNLNIDQYGNIIGIFSNGNSLKLAQIMVATFKNLNALVSVGDNMYNVAANSGDPRIDAPGENSVTTIQSGALEQSNVDLSEEFTRMIISQRGFQANARVITTADTMLQEITNLIR